MDVGRTARRWLRASERCGRMLGNTVEVYHIYICVFGNFILEELSPTITFDSDKTNFSQMSNPHAP